ncbi:AAA domain-containing protein [bacterium]|jgi:ATP-dependent Clp protease ATP-binding subunit ClpC|nr:AAA domain-containing protein [bacterium]MBT4251621.1 AAA domain-containing protein [bacterium]MBT4597670.1 AAA domain-containing protein [bacterium]MBT6753683.1 AAA domain-containing protein [bacterium]MBT7037820.1 AAA domain-containing protein [bacterium]
MGFFLWYWTKGIKGYFVVWNNFLSHFWKFFSVKHLFATLFSAWRKDLTPKDWIGLHPILEAQRFVVNLIFRFFGAIVRFIVASFGILVVSVVFIIGFLFMIVWGLAPVVLIFSIIGITLGERLYGFSLFAIILFFIAAMLMYLEDKKIPYSELPVEKMPRFAWFKRIAQRIGMAPSELTAGLLADKEKLTDVLKKYDVSIDEFNLILKWEMDLQVAKEKEGKFWLMENLRKSVPIGKGWEYGYTVTIDRHALELSSYDPTEYRLVLPIGYDEEIEMSKLVLAKEEQNNVLLMGDSGVGKKAIMHHIAKQVMQGKAGQNLNEKRFMLVDLGSTISAVVNEGGDPEHALHSLFQEAALAGNIILAIDEIGKYLDPGKKSSINVAAVIDRYLMLPNFQVIATTTRKNYHSLVEKQEGIIKNFDIIEIEEPSDNEAIRILLQKFSELEHDQVIFTFQAIREIVRRSSQLGKIMPLPGRAIGFANNVLLYWEKNHANEGKRIGVEDVFRVMSIKTGVKHGEISEEEKDKLMSMEKLLHSRVIGQDGAVTQIANSIRKMRAGIRNIKKPVGSFLFLGPTGVGKTETAKALAEVHFGDEERMIRIDMSEYKTQNSIGRLIGSPATGEVGILTTKAKDSPFSLILLDEIEKAHSDILDLFLQVLDEGYITDGFGEKISFRGSIIIATSNAGAPLIKTLVEQKVEAEELRKRLVDHIVNEGMFRVEFLNRFDAVVFFRALKNEQMKEVISLMLQKFAVRVEREKNISVKFGDKVVECVIEKGYDPVFGARSINRYISDKIEDTIATKIIAHDVERGGEVLLTTDDF